MGEASALVISGVDDDLGFASQPSERCGMDDTIPITLETGTLRIWILGNGTIAGTLARVAPGRSSRFSRSSRASRPTTSPMSIRAVLDGWA